MKSTEFLQAAIDVQNQRAAEYDQPGGERSMGRTVQAFNAVTGKDLTEAEGWLFLQTLKDVRQWSAKGYHHDSALDGVSYSALKAEALAAQQDPEVPTDLENHPALWLPGDWVQVEGVRHTLRKISCAMKMAWVEGRPAGYGFERVQWAGRPGVPDGQRSVTYSVPQVLGFDPTDPGQWMRGDIVEGGSGTLYEFVRVAGNYAEVIYEGHVDSALLSNLQWVSRPEPQAPWMPYTGGPVPELPYVEVCMADGSVAEGHPSQFVWGGHGTKGRITHYRPAVQK